MSKPNDRILDHELFYLIERNLKSACDIEDTERKLEHILRAMELMSIQKERSNK